LFLVAGKFNCRYVHPNFSAFASGIQRLLVALATAGTPVDDAAVADFAKSPCSNEE
jgi:hypothetical protein